MLRSTLRMPQGWATALQDSAAIKRLSETIDAQETAGTTIFPPAAERLAALDMTPPDKVRVVILGQDPYHGAGQAHGLAFSVRDGVRPPPSLVNIFKEIESDLGVPRPSHGNLGSWARGGVLLLNNALTVEEGRAGSHQTIGWQAITDAIIAAVADGDQPCVFMLWGNHAQKKATRVPALGAERHLVLRAAHPSPLSAHNGFFGCRHFSQANAFLDRAGRGVVDWRL